MHVRVRDTGIGIAPEFFLACSTFSFKPRLGGPPKGGLGIGLALVKRLVELHQGRVEAHSVLGEGSEFIVTLPAVLAPTSRPPATTAPALD